MMLLLRWALIEDGSLDPVDEVDQIVFLYQELFSGSCKMDLTLCFASSCHSTILKFIDSRTSPKRRFAFKMPCPLLSPSSRTIVEVSEADFLILKKSQMLRWRVGV